MPDYHHNVRNEREGDPPINRRILLLLKPSTTRRSLNKRRERLSSQDTSLDHPKPQKKTETRQMS